MGRDVAWAIRLSEEEREFLRELSEWLGLNQSDVVRQLIRKEHEKQSGKRQK